MPSPSCLVLLAGPSNAAPGEAAGVVADAQVAESLEVLAAAETQPGIPEQVQPVGNETSHGDASQGDGNRKEPTSDTEDEQPPPPPPSPRQPRKGGVMTPMPTPSPTPTSPAFLAQGPRKGEGVEAAEGEGGRKRPPGDADDDAEQELYVASVPPEVLSEKAIYMRLHRVSKKRKYGTYILDTKWNDAWGDVDGGGRDSLYSIFEKVAYNRDRRGQT